MLKPTVLYWIVAIGMFIAAQMGKNGIKILLNQQFPLPDKTWQQLNRLWIIFLIVMGGVNLLVAFNFSEAVWVSFKVFGTMIATLILTIITGIIVYQQTKHRINSN